MLYRFAAGKYADVATLQAAHELGMEYDSAATIEGAVYCNELAVVQFLRAQEGSWWTNHVYNIAARRGDMALCAYLYANQCGWSLGTCEAAASNGDSGLLRWLREHDCPWNEDSISNDAAEGGSVDALEFLQEEEGIEFTADMLTKMLLIAGANSKLEAAQWLRKQGAEWPAVLRWQRWREQLTCQMMC
jgi:hypothetical protein